MKIINHIKYHMARMRCRRIRKWWWCQFNQDPKKILMASFYLSERSGLGVQHVFGILMGQDGYRGRLLINASDSDYIWIYQKDTSMKTKRCHLG